MKRKLAPFDTWPDLRIELHLLPWHWRLRPWLWVDDVDGALAYCTFAWWFFSIEWWGQKGGWLDQFTERVGESKVFVPFGEVVVDMDAAYVMPSLIRYTIFRDAFKQPYYSGPNGRVYVPEQQVNKVDGWEYVELMGLLP